MSLLFRLLGCLLLMTAGGKADAHVPHDIIYSLDVSPNFADDGLVFASSTQFGEAHLRSSNYGETFSESHAGMRRTLVTGHTFSPNFQNDGVVFMATEQGYYRSGDRGDTWQPHSEFKDQRVLSIGVDREFARTKSIVVLTEDALHAVDAQGNTRQLRRFDATTFGRVFSAGGKLFVHRVHYPKAEKKNGMERVTYDTGTVDVMDLQSGEWSTLASQFDSAIIATVDVTPDGSNAAVALTDGTIHLSSDAGQSWKQSHQREDDFFCKIRFSPDFRQDHTLAAGTAKGFFLLSEDSGIGWKIRSNGLSRWVHHVNILINRLVFSPNYKQDKTIFLGKTTGIYKTTDAGKYWRHINIWNTKWSYFVYAAPGKQSKDLFTATYNSGISRSADHGDHWSSANIGITSAFANGMALSPNFAEDHSIFVLDIATGLYRSRDGGLSWSGIPQTDTAKMVGKPVLYRKLGVSPDFKDDGLMYLFTVPRRVLGVPEKHTWKYNDKTHELTLLSIGGDKNYVNGFSFSPQGSSPKSVFAATARGAFVSTNDGATWRNLTPGHGAERLLVSPNYPADGLLYLMDPAGGIKVSKDFGESFTATDLNLDGKYIDNLSFSPGFAVDQTLFATAFGEGVFRSQDAGQTWQPLGLRGKLLFSGPTFSSNYAADRTLFAPAVDGVYRSTNDGETCTNVLDQTQLLPKVPQLVLRDPLGKEIPLTFGVPEQMKRYGVYDQEIAAPMYSHNGNTFQRINDPRAYLASYYRFRVQPKSAVEITFFGTGVEYKCVTAKDMGIVELELDGRLMGEFDLYSEDDQFDVTGFATTQLEKGLHRLRIVATGRKNPASQGTAISYNAATITNRP